jgi:hypothetical protein
VLRTLAHELHHFTLTKKDIEWDLEELEEVRVVKSWQWYIDAIVFVGCPPNEGYGDGRWR